MEVWEVEMETEAEVQQHWPGSMLAALIFAYVCLRQNGFYSGVCAYGSSVLLQPIVSATFL